MVNPSQREELNLFIKRQFERLAVLLAEPLEPGDTLFVHHAMPEWVGMGVQHRFAVLPMPASAAHPHVLCMDVDFGPYHRRMELISGSREDLLQFASAHQPVSAVGDAIVELLQMEREAKG